MARYSTPPTGEADNGALISVVVGNAGGEATTSAAALTVVSPAAPAITQQPASASAALGSTATFTVGAAGTDLAYQWRRNGVDIAGATAARYTTPPATDDGARFSVVVSNADLASTVSTDAVLAVFAGWAGIIEDGAPGLARDSALAVAADWQRNLVISGTSDAGDFAGDPACTQKRTF
ncbi:hypothetical protein [Massilia sp. TWR1-2-2]|uniref:hypothetical protein n=1 Tax=Massilia sp. TWR1-2-2 TaxID=2804584 RepID=UPI003CEBD4ED